MAMLFSFFVAVTITPWLLLRIARKRFEGDAAGAHGEGHHEGAMGAFYRRIAAPLLTGTRKSKVLLLSVGVATLAACALFDRGRRRSAARQRAGGHRPRTVGRRRSPEGSAGADHDPGLCRYRRAVQFQWARAPLLLPRVPGAG
jgi:hypothetical protein